MGRRGNASNPISLFSFQDIITSVTGIMILVTLMMTLELVQRSANSPAIKTEEIVREVKPAVEDVRRRIDELKRRLERESVEASVAAGLNAKTVRERLADARRRTDALQAEVAQLDAAERDAARRREASVQTVAQVAAQEEERSRTEAEVRRLQTELDKLKSTNRIVFNRDPGNSKSPWLVDLAGTAITVAQVGVSAAPTVFQGGTVEESVSRFETWTGGRDSDAEYFVLLVRPSSVETFHHVQRRLADRGYDFGFDVLTEQQVVIDPQTGASAP